MIVRIRLFPIVRTSWPVLHRLEADAAHGGVERIDGDGSEVQPVAAERMFEREDVAGERLARDESTERCGFRNREETSEKSVASPWTPWTRTRRWGRRGGLIRRTVTVDGVQDGRNGGEITALPVSAISRFASARAAL